MCAREGHDLSADCTKCLRCGAASGEHARLLRYPMRFVSGKPVCALVTTDDRWGYDRAKQLKRPLVVGDRVITTGLLNEPRTGTVVIVDGKRATVDDDHGMWWYPEFDKDDDHGWTVRSFASKECMNAEGDFTK